MFWTIATLVALIALGFAALAMAKTIRGNDRDNLLEGTSKKDRIYGKGGEDRIFAGDGADRVNAGTGEDLVNGEEDLRVLDFNGHQIMANFSLQALGEPVKFEG